MDPALEIAHDVSDLELATDAPGFGLEIEQPAETPTDAPVRDEQGRFVSKEAPTDAEKATEPEPAPESVAEEPAPEPEPEPEPAPKKDTPEELAKKKVPYTRFKEAVEKERQKQAALTEEVEQLRKRLESVESPDVDDAELTRLADMLIEGKTSEYAAGMKGILEKVFQKGVKVATEKAEAVSRVSQVHQTEVNERQAAADYWAAQYPQFNPESEAFDADLVDEALALRDAYESRGISPGEAIGRAVRLLAASHGLDKPAEPEPEPAKPAAPRRTPDVPKKMEAAKAQPPTPAANVGEVERPTSTLSRVASMTPEQFDRWSEQHPEEYERLLNGDA